jgi:hypothetical protein
MADGFCFSLFFVSLYLSLPFIVSCCSVCCLLCTRDAPVRRCG